MAAEQIVIAPFLAMLLTAILTLLTRRWSRLQAGISLAGASVYMISVAMLMTKVFPDNVLTYQLSGWPAPYGITFVADALTGFMLSTTAVLILPALVFSLAYIDDFGRKLSFLPLFNFMVLGITGAFLTGDIFNLFVWFEVMLMSSYILVSFYGGKKETKATLQYITVNLIGSAFMLVAIGGIYATTGTLNMADLAARLGNPAASNVAVAPVLGLSAILFCVFALKAGIAPFQFWVPPAYRAAPAPVTALLAGAAKKVGIYAIIRLYLGVFSAASIQVSLFGITGNSFLAFYGPLVLAMSVLSIIIGGLGAVGRDNLDELLAYSSIGQLGFILLPIGLAAVNPGIAAIAVTASLVYVLNHAAAKGLLFLSSGAIRSSTNTDELDELGGLMDKSPLLAAAFLIGALSLIGIPPLLGFFGKMLVFQTSVYSLYTTAALGSALVGGLLTIIYFSRAWNQVFWGETVEMGFTPGFKLQLASIAVLAVFIVVAGIGVNTVIEMAQHAADAALNPQGYVDAVIKTGGHNFVDPSANQTGQHVANHTVNSTVKEVNRTVAHTSGGGGR